MNEYKKLITSLRAVGGDDKVSDLICREALKDRLHSLFVWYGQLPCSEKDKLIQQVIKRCMGEVDKMPTVDVEPVRHGRWIKKRGKCSADFICSVCGYTFTDGDPEYECDYLGCPMCRAKMDEAALDAEKRGEKVSRSKVYIAGKITGDDNYWDKFFDAEEKASRLFGTVLNPANNPEGLSKADYMRICFAMIDSADAALFLPDWNDSEGARLEHAFCEYTGKPILYLTDL